MAESAGPALLISSERERPIVGLEEVLDEVAALLNADEASDAAQLQELRAARETLLRPWLIVAVGEMNAGKSSLLNALLGTAVFAVDATAPHDTLTRLSAGDAAQDSISTDGQQLVFRPLPHLQRLTVVDTPPAALLLSRYAAWLRDTLPRADAVLLVTSAERPLTERERGLLQLACRAGAPVVLVLTKIDRLLPDELMQTEQYVRSSAAEICRTTVPFTALSTPQAGSGLTQLGQQLGALLNDAARLRGKLQPPLSAAERILTALSLTVHTQLLTLAGDLAALEQHERLLAQVRDEIAGVTAFQRHALDQQLALAAERGEQYLQERFSLRRPVDLVQPQAVAEGLVQQVMDVTLPLLEQPLQQLAERLTELGLQVQQRSTELRQRAAASAEPPDEAADAALWPSAEQLFSALQATLARVLAGYDQAGASQRLISRMREALAIGALTTITALGLAVVLVLLLQTRLLDVIAVAAAVGLGLLGWLMVPYQRRAAQLQLRERIAGLRIQLAEQVSAQTAQIAQQGLQQARAHSEPFARQVRSRQQQMQQRQAAVQALQQRAAQLRATINGDGTTQSQ